MRQALTNAAKKWLYRRIGISFNSVGVPFALAKYLRPKSPITLVDVGAHHGHFTRSIDKLCGVKMALLIEAQPIHAKTLSSNLPAERFKVVNCAASDRPGQIDLQINNFDATTSILRTKREIKELEKIDVRLREVVKCPTAKLDDLVDEAIFPTLNLLKIDVQGAENLVLNGAQQTLARTNMVWVEVSFVRLYEQSALFHETHHHMRSKGFQLAELQDGFRGPTGELLQADALFIRQ